MFIIMIQFEFRLGEVLGIGFECVVFFVSCPHHGRNSASMQHPLLQWLKHPVLLQISLFPGVGREQVPSVPSGLPPCSLTCQGGCAQDGCRGPSTIAAARAFGARWYSTLSP